MKRTRPTLPRRLLRPAFLAALLLATALAVAVRAGPIYFSQVVTDPQADHSENAGGNGVPYDDQPGTGTVSSVDEFVEIYNATSGTLDLTGYLLQFADTTPSSYRIGTSTSGTLRLSGGSTITSFQPNAFLLLGNPPGALNNAITLKLLDPGGGLVDSWQIDDGNATGTDDEAVHRFAFPAHTGYSVFQGPITPLAVPPDPDPPGESDAPALPEPAGAYPLLIAGLALLATWRRARRATRRRRIRAPGRPCRDLRSLGADLEGPSLP